MKAALLATLAALVVLSHQEDTMPSCLSTCLSQSTNPCTPSSLPSLIYCLNTNCTTTPSSPSSIHLAYTPKLEYSCEQSLVPGSSTPSDTLTLSGAGECSTSPYEFQSFVAGSATAEMAAQCGMVVYGEQGCEGEGRSVGLKVGTLGGCQFVGGRSARLDCGDGEDASAALSHLNTMCNITSSSSSLLSPSDESSATSSPATSSHTVPAQTTLGLLVTGTASSIINATLTTASATNSMMPYIGMADLGPGFNVGLMAFGIGVALL